MKALFKRDMLLYWRQGSAGLTACIFFLALIITLPFALGPDLPLLTRLAPALIWIGAFLAALLGAETLFKDDKADGSLDLLILSNHPLSLLVGVKALALFIATSLPLIVMIPFLSLLLNLDPENLPYLIISLLIGLPSLTLLSTFGAAIAVAFNKGGILTAILILPLAFPVLIFGVSAAKGDLNALILLAALLLVFIATLPFLSALAIKEGLE